MWKITAYNKTVWESSSMMTLTEAITRFCKDTGLHEVDIKEAMNLH